MAKITVVFGLLLIALGVIGYTGSGTPDAAADTANDSASTDADPNTRSVDDAATPAKKGKSATALIPAIFGGLLVLFGLLAFKESMLKHAMHGASVVGLLGVIAGVGRGAMGLGKFFSGDPSLNQRSFLFVWLMAIICGIFLTLCVRSFIAAKKRRLAAEAANAA